MHTADILLGRPSPHNHDGIPAAAMPAGAPSIAGALRELTGVVEVARLIRAAPWLARAPRGEGAQVIDLPGWKAPEATLGASAYGREECERIEALAARLDAETPIRVPITAIYTRRDGVVDWRACIDRTSPNVVHVEVRATHLSLGIDPDVWWATAAALAKP